MPVVENHNGQLHSKRRSYDELTAVEIQQYLQLKYA